MERAADPVAGVVAHHAVAEPLRVRLDRAADDVHLPAGGDGADAAGERLAGALDEQRGLLARVADEEGVVEVAVVPVEVGGDVDVDEVAVLEHRVVGDAVADHLVDRRARRLRVAAVAERRRVRAVGDDVLVRDAVELVGGDARPDRGCRGLDRPRGDPAGGTDPLDLLGRVPVAGGVRSGRATAHVLGPGDRCGDGAGRRQASGDQVAGGILGHRISLWRRMSSTSSGTT